MRCCLVFFCCVGMISPSWGGATPYYGWMFFFDQAVLSESGKLDEGVMSRVEYDNTVDMFDDPTDEDTKQILHPIIEEMVNFYIDNLKTNLTDTQRAVNLPSHTAKFEAWAQGESGQDLEYLKNAFQIKMKCEDWYKRLVALCKAYRKYEQNSGVGSSVVVVDYASKSYTQSPGRTIDYVASAEVHQQYDMFVNDLHKELLQECNLSGKVQRFKLALEERMREVAQQSFNDCLVLDIKNFSATLGKGASASVHMMCSRMLRAAGIPLRYNLTRVNKGANQKKTSVHVHLYQEWSEGEKVEEWPPALQVDNFLQLAVSFEELTHVLTSRLWQ